jgi:hypothetical protein
VLVLLPALMVRASTARADEPTPSPAPEPAPPVSALIYYQDDAKNSAAAVVLEIVMPGLGSVYAEDHWGAAITWGLLAAGATAVLVGASMVPPDDAGGPGLGSMQQKTNPLALPLVIGGLAVAVYGRVYGVQNAIRASDRYNTALRTSLGLTPFVTSDAGGLTLGGRF